MAKETNDMITGTLFPNGVPVDYLTQMRGMPWPRPSAAMIVAGEAIKQGYSVIYINLEKEKI